MLLQPQELRTLVFWFGKSPLGSTVAEANTRLTLIKRLEALLEGPPESINYDADKAEETMIRETCERVVTGGQVAADSARHLLELMNRMEWAS